MPMHFIDTQDFNKSTLHDLLDLIQLANMTGQNVSC